MNNEYEIFGCAYDCPLQKRNLDCPFNEIEHLTFKEKVAWIKDASTEKKESIMQHHLDCERNREQTKSRQSSSLKNKQINKISKNMKTFNKQIAILLCGIILLGSCSSTKNSTKGGVIGGAGGALLGAGIGALVGHGKGAAIGAAVGGAVGAGAGVVIGKKMDKQKAELEKIEGAKVESVTDVNNLQAIKVTFDSGILFSTGKSDLNASSKTALTKFAASLKETPETDVTIYGHTDNTGSRETNVQLSKNRAASVASFLNSNGISTARMTTEGKAFDEPVADNSTAEGRAQNRRVEIYITANEQMINQAEQGTLK